MFGVPDKYIKVNIPMTEKDYHFGNGEGVWVEVDQETRRAYNRDAIGSGYHGILANDSLYYPGLSCGDMIEFEMRGANRPVVPLSFLQNRDHLTEAGKAMLVGIIAGRKGAEE